MFGFAFPKDITVVTDIGNITGEVEDITFVDETRLHITKFLGIPYAEPPTGSRRFDRPIIKSGNLGNFIAKTMPPTCFQNAGFLTQYSLDPNPHFEDEDCLYLNIYIPGNLTEDETTKFAVMIWIYGGAFQFGYQNMYEAKAFPGLNNVILVTFNYRVSLLGYLSTSENNFSGNYGLWDQHMAIKWVHDHIGNFGGDPTNITIFGESAGAASVIYQTLYEGNERLFQRAIAQSGSVNLPWAYDENPSTDFVNFANKSACLHESHMEIIKCLRNVSFADLTHLVAFEDVFYPVMDGEFVKSHPKTLFLNTTDEASDTIKRMGKFDFIIGLNSAEAGLYIPLVDQLIAQSGQDISNGYRKVDFEKVIVPFAMKGIGKLRQTNTLEQAIINKYIEWSDPGNTTAVFQTTLDLLSDIAFNAGITKSAMAHSDTGESGSLYFYLFDSKSPFSDPRYSGAMHFEDVAYVLGYPPSFANIYFSRNVTISQREIDLSKSLMKYWTNFAKTGDPNRGSDTSPLTPWPEYDSETQAYIRFRSDVTSFLTEIRFEASRMNFWNKLVPVMMQSCEKSCEICEATSYGVTFQPGIVISLSVISVILM